MQPLIVIDLRALENMSSLIFKIYNAFQLQFDMSRDLRGPTMCYMRPTKAQTNLRIRAV